MTSPSVLEKEIKCLNLSIFPPEESIQTTLHELYSFDKNCDIDLVVSYKNSIVCNSSHNADRKALGMATSYLRLELKIEKKLLYSYYIDLVQDLTSEDIKNGFNVMKDTVALNLK